MNARELICFNIEDCEAEKGRIALMISDLMNLSHEAKLRLADDLVQIAINPSEQLLHRVQAASMLSHQSHKLDIKGAGRIAHSLLRTLNEEFIPSAIVIGFQTEDTSSIRLKSLNQMELFLFQDIIRAIAVIDFPSGKQLFEGLIILMKGTETASWLANLVRRRGGELV